MYNGSPMGPGFFVFFNIQDTNWNQRFTVTDKKPDDEILSLIPVLLKVIE